MTTEKVFLPNIGDFGGVEVIEVPVKVGISIVKEDTLLVLETDKATMDVPSPVTGKLSKLAVKVGDKISQGDLIAEIVVKQDNAHEDIKKEDKQKNQKQNKKQDKKQNKEQDKNRQKGKSVPDNTESSSVEGELAREAESEVEHELERNLMSKAVVSTGPATRRLAREFNVDLASVTGTGRKGRVTTMDLIQHISNNTKTASTTASTNNLDLFTVKGHNIDFRQFGEVESKALSRIKQKTAANLMRNWLTIPHVTQFDEADITEMEQFRQENKKLIEAKGAKLTPLVFIMKAVVSALKAFPQFNSSLSANGQELVLKKYYHLGIAVDTEDGLVVPVIKDVDLKSMSELALELKVVSEKAREGKLTAKDMQGGSFTISSLGGIGGLGFTPIINAPDVAILGVSRSEVKPHYAEAEDRFIPRLKLPFALSYDHRVIDGAEAARFTRYLAEKMADIRRLLL